jgi:hypothetical protein
MAVAGRVPGDKTPLPRLFGKYELLREAGKGGRGIVYEAKDTVLARTVALKMILSRVNAEDTEADERFLVEARLLAGLPKHPHIVTVHDAGVIDGKRYMAMEFIEGRPMGRGAKTPALPLARAVRILRDVALAVEHAHRHGLVHRDLKPENILVDKRGEPHVTDFGMAFVAGKRSGAGWPTEGMICGTPSYMSPEQAQGLASVDHRTDIFSLGIMLYEILAGRKPFQGDTSDKILDEVVRGEIPKIPERDDFKEMRKALEGVCERALAKQPARRFPSALAFAGELSRVLGKNAGPSRRTIAIAAGGLVLVLGGLAIAVFRSHAQPEPSGDLERAAERRRVEEEHRVQLEKTADETRREADIRAREKEKEYERRIDAVRRSTEEESLKLKVEQAKLEAAKREAEEESRALAAARAASAEPKEKPAAEPVPAAPAIPNPAAASAGPPSKPPVANVTPEPMPGPQVPEAGKVREAERLIRDRFKSDYARASATDKRALAEKLLGYAQREKADPVARFVLLREARDLAAQAVDLTISLAAVEELAKSYGLDPTEMAAGALATASKNLRTPAQGAALAEASLPVAERAISGDQYELAAGVLSRAEAAARGGQNPPLLAQIQTRSRDLVELRKDFQRVKGAEKLLSDKPDDGASHLVVGKFYGFTKREWERGLPHLAKGNDAPLRAVAERDLAAPADALGMVSAGDGWWDWAEKQAGQTRARAQERALGWYEQAWPKAGAAAKARLRNRFRQALAHAGGAKASKSTELPAPWAGGMKGLCVLEDRYSHGGLCSVRTARSMPAKPDEDSIGPQYPTIPAQPGEEYRFSGWVMTDGNAADTDVLDVIALGADGLEIGRGSVALPADQPWWTSVGGSFTCPAGTTTLLFRLEMSSTEGAVWLDDVSLRRTGDERELVQNPSFEPR